MDWWTAPGELFGRERRLLKELAERAAVRFGPHICIVNIGVGMGASLHCLRAGAPNAKLIGIDLDTSQLLGDPCAILIEGDSGELAAQRQVDSEVHLLFVDGGHDRATVTKDILGWTGKVLSRGLVAFHDYYGKRNLGVRHAVNEWRAQPEWADCWKHVDSRRLTIVFERA